MTAAVSASKEGQSINIEQFSDVLESSQIESRLDIGSAVIYRVKHHALGAMILVNTSAGHCASLLN